MNLITRLRNLFYETRQPETMLHATTDNSPLYQQLLSVLQQACADVPGGKAFLICGNGEFGIRLTWKPEATATDTPKQVYCIEGNGKATEWEELPKEEVAEEQPINTIQSQAIQDSSPKKEEKAPKQQQIMQQLIGHLEEHYSFRYNRLADRTECAATDAGEAAYMPVDQRALNSIVLRAMDEGIACWDRDVKRYVESAHVPAYHPFIHYFDNLPEWDGQDRITGLARRVSDDGLWINSFHRWMLACTAQWMGREAYSQRANSVAPILISTQQGLGKSTFCRMLLPKPLQDYFTESFDLNNASGAENKLAACGLINIDEFDRLPATRLPQLKNLMQMESLRIRRAYKRNAEPLPRIASFIGTSNRLDLLTDLSGSRRFICVEVERAIDCTTPIDYGQLYAQLKHEIEQGERYWFSKEEEAAIQQSNRKFYRVTPAEELVGTCFRFVEPGEPGARLMSAADMYAVLKRKNAAALRDCSCTAFSRLLAQMGRRVHTRYGNGYWVKAPQLPAPSTPPEGELRDTLRVRE
ncbi:hypothetical protein EVD33_00955 [Bacteroidales bacterium SW292]|nr:hypothetical protein [Bacteroidales bacterium SW292]